MKNPAIKRYLSDHPLKQEEFLDAARAYVKNRNSWETAALYKKPFFSGNPRAFFAEIYPVLNLIEAMAVPPRGRILEVGCGPGWVTEILALLGYEVHAIDPSADMIEIAQRRIRTAVDHYKLDAAPNVTFYPIALEDSVPLPSAFISGVIFHAALHHVVDERKGLAECFRLLQQGGVLGVSEWAWDPNNKEMEEQLDEEMRAFGTLENPFGPAYLETILKEAGFVNIERFHAINGFIPASLGDRRIKDAAQAIAADTNNLTAQKPYPVITTAEKSAESVTRARMVVEKSEWSADRSGVRLALTIANTGQSVWVCRGIGAVKVSLRSGQLGTPKLIEADRRDLPSDVLPGQSITLGLSFFPPGGKPNQVWSLDMLAEERFWFSANGNEFPVLRSPNR